MEECQDHQELRVISNKKLPLRLIDVPATIASAGGVSFTGPSDWNFHVISHTWSLSIRKLSKAVGQSIGSSTGNPQLYNDAFRGSSFNGEPGYTHFIRFLEVLMGDGVRKVWFDALCINQAANAKEEKDSEISHMGAYYKHSVGCYVVLHGFGQGFDLLGKREGFNFLGEQMDFEWLPRWFSRVWTLQEFLLPEKLTFVVSRPSTTAPYCRFCTSEENNVASEAAVGMVTIEMESVDGSTIEIDVMELLYNSKGAFLNMLEELAEHCITFIPQISECLQIGEEDRVLSILSLLGVEGRMSPVRSDQTLEKQVVKLAQELAKVNPRLLLEMCAKDVTSSPHKGLSWMPNLGAPDHMISASRHTDQWRMRHARVQLKEVTSEGSLRLEGHVVGAHLVVGARGSMEQHFNEAHCYTCLKSRKLDSRGIRLLLHQMQDCHLEVPQILSIPLHASAFVEATIEGWKPDITQQGGCIIRLDTRWMRLHSDFCPSCDEIYAGGLHLQIPCLHFMASVDLMLLLWAEVEGGESIVMLCMGTIGLQLHKIGMVRIAQEVSNAIFLSNKPTSEYNLGGFGSHNVKKFWLEWGSIQRSIPCNCSRSIIQKAIKSRIAFCATLQKFINTKLRKKKCDSPLENIYFGPLEGMPCMSGPPPWPSNGIVAMNWMREKFLKERIDYFLAIAEELGAFATENPKLKEARCFCRFIESRNPLPIIELLKKN